MIEALPMPPVVAAVLILVTRWGFLGLLHFLQATIFYESGKQSNETYFCISGL